MPGRRQPLTRSEVMSRIRGKDTGPELVLRRALWTAGMRYRTQWRHPDAGRIDIAFPGMRIAILVDGCFWHGCPEHSVKPKTNSVFWNNKLAANQARDSRQMLALERDGWLVLRCWEHEIETAVGLAAVMERICKLIASRKGTTR